MKYLEYLRRYRGRPLRLMEVCGTHTAQIHKTGIPALLPPSIQLVSGPGCPVCVTVSAYIDRLIALGMEEQNRIVTFGDMLRVPGSRMSLNEARAQGCVVRMVYSPMDTLKMAAKDPEHIYIFAAVGFETTAPVYCMMIKRAKEQGITNLRLLTSLKVMPPAIDWICAHNQQESMQGFQGSMQGFQGSMQGFLAPGHVCVITGSRAFEGLAAKYGIPFVVAGFEGEQLLAAIAALVKLQGQGRVVNMYPSAVTREGNTLAQAELETYFEPCDAAWRGMGIIPGSGRKLRPEYASFDAGSDELMADDGGNPACRCAQVLMGRIRPQECPLFGTACTPQSPQGACMVSMEGSCFNCWQAGGLTEQRNG